MTRIAVNGFGRVGRLALRAGWERSDLAFVHVNELKGGAASAAHLLTFDSVHGRWERGITGESDRLTIDGQDLRFTEAANPGDVPWEQSEVDVVLECSGKFRTIESLAPYFQRGVRKVVVAAPVKDPAALNVVVGVNDDRYEPEVHDVLTCRC
jgi:glyceraldehyde 3-phosphate dehydrogenase